MRIVTRARRVLRIATGRSPGWFDLSVKRPFYTSALEALVAALVGLAVWVLVFGPDLEAFVGFGIFAAAYTIGRAWSWGPNGYLSRRPRNERGHDFH